MKTVIAAVSGFRDPGMRAGGPMSKLKFKRSGLKKLSKSVFFVQPRSKPVQTGSNWFKPVQTGSGIRRAPRSHPIVLRSNPRIHYLHLRRPRPTPHPAQFTHCANTQSVRVLAHIHNQPNPTLPSCIPRYRPRREHRPGRLMATPASSAQQLL